MVLSLKMFLSGILDVSSMKLVIDNMAMASLLVFIELL
jgi:hypothetical protein